MDSGIRAKYSVAWARQTAFLAEGLSCHTYALRRPRRPRTLLTVNPLDSIGPDEVRMLCIDRSWGRISYLWGD
jgi:hypothetical protein